MAESSMATLSLQRATGETRKMGEGLMERGLLTARKFEYALQKQSVEQLRFGTLLVKHGLVSEYDVAQELAKEKNIEFLTVERFPKVDPTMMQLFNRELCLQNGFLPLRRGDNVVEVLLGDSDDARVIELVRRKTGLSCKFYQAEFTRVARYIREVYYFSQHPVETLLEKEIRQLSNDIDQVYSPDRFMEFLLHKAVYERTTDIHLSPSGTSLHLLFRIDGVLRPMMALPPAMARIIAYVKIIAKMEVSEQRRPQDGSFHTMILDQPYAIRVSILPTSEFGERMVLRLLPERSELTSLEQLGFIREDVQRVERLFALPAGMILVTGPTGSGKSTTLHAAMQIQSLIETNVLTIEDPIEYRVPGTAQTEVNRRAEYEFSNALRFFLRHDPDVILIGEIRDAETALAAVEASATGHLVLSTLHVSSVFGVVPRLYPFGLEPQVIADNLLAVINQRLVRENCPHCSVPVDLSSKAKQWLGSYVDENFAPKRGVGCSACGYSGYWGRLPVYEILEVDQKLGNLIADRAPREKMQAYAHEQGFKGYAEQAKWRICRGQTTLEEVLRVIGEGVAE